MMQNQTIVYLKNGLLIVYLLSLGIFIFNVIEHPKAFNCFGCIVSIFIKSVWHFL
jgi:hypothetical protein